MNKKSKLFGVIAVFAITFFLLIGCEGPMGPQGPDGRPGDASDWRVVDLDAGDAEVTVVLGVPTIFTGEVNQDAVIQTLLWELYDEEVDGQIIRIHRALSARNAMIGGRAVAVTGLIEGEARLLVTAMGSGEELFQTVITITVEGLATEFSQLPAKVTAATLPETFTFTAFANEAIAPVVLDFGFDTNTTQVTVVVTMDDPNIVLSVNDLGSMFTVGKGVHLILEDVTLRGRPDNTRPLVVVNDGGRLTMNAGSEITGNANTIPIVAATWEENSPHMGGGVRINEGGSLIMNAGSQISGNSSAWGGGVLNEGTFTMTGGTVAGNSALSIPLFLLGTNNVIATSSAFGGGIMNNASFSMTDGLITANTSENASGGVHNEGIFEMHNSTISNNFARVNGGAMIISAGGEFTMHSGNLIDNRTPNEISNEHGGAVLVGGTGSTFIMHTGVISGSASTNGGAVAVEDGGTFIMWDGEISNNRSGWEGAGVRVSGGTFTMHDGIISDNSTTVLNSAGGGGVFVIARGNISTAGGIVHFPATFTMYDGKIVRNSTTANATGTPANANNGGGGVRVGVNHANAATTFNMHGGVISDNFVGASGVTQGGGGVFVQGTFNMFDGEISGNTSNMHGGGVRIHSATVAAGLAGTFNMLGGTISGNIAGAVNTGGQGGGIFHAGGHNGRVRIEEGTIYGNTASPEGLRNTAPTGSSMAILAALAGIGAAQYGSFDVAGDPTSEWTPAGDLLSTGNGIGSSHDTIDVVAGDMNSARGRMASAYGAAGNITPAFVPAVEEDERQATFDMSLIKRIPE